MCSLRTAAPVESQPLLEVQTMSLRLFLLVVALLLLALLLCWPLSRRAELTVETHGSEVGLVVPGPALEPTTTTAKPVPTTVPRRVVRSAPTLRTASAAPAVSSVAPSDRWIALADCESGDGDGRAPFTMNDTYRGYHHGALQWHPDTWARARRMSGLPVAESAADAPFADEVAVAKVWLRATSPRQWPVCGPKVGLTMADAA